MSGHTSFSCEYTWSRTWIPKIRIIVGPWILREGTLHEDRCEATDLIVLKANGLRVACRVRRPGYQLFNDFTITCERESGAPCEWDKLIIEGFADWLFYGHATANDPRSEDADIKPRYLIDLAVARTWIRENHGPRLGPNKDEPGRRCWFYAFEIERMVRALGQKCLIAANHGAGAHWSRQLEMAIARGMG